MSKDFRGQRVGWINMKLGTEVGLNSSHTASDEDPAPPLQKGAGHSNPNFGPCIVAKIGGAVYCALPMYCGQMAGWIKMTLRREVDLGPGDIVLDGDSATPPKKGGQSTPQYWPMYCGQTAGSRCHLVGR